MKFLRGVPKPATGEELPAWCPKCGARVPPGQVGRSAGRRACRGVALANRVLYCTVCGEYWVIGRSRARRASLMERRIARRDLFAARGLGEPAPGG